jgi:hypothetical protein
MPTETIARRDKRPAPRHTEGAHPAGCAAPVLDEEPNGAGGGSQRSVPAIRCARSSQVALSSSRSRLCRSCSGCS